jgi:hypothetical protein
LEPVQYYFNTINGASKAEGGKSPQENGHLLVYLKKGG